jgi:hypothetical protein
MKPETLRKLSALGLSVEQIAGVMEIMAEDAEEGKEKARERWRRWKNKQPTNVGKRLQTDANVGKQLVRVEDSSSKEDISGEEKKEDAAPTARPKATRIPDDFVPDEQWAFLKGLTPAQARTEAEQFIDFWRGKSGANGTKQDWPATWRVWVRNSINRQPPPRSQAPPRQLTQGESLRNMAREAGVIDDTGNPIRRVETRDRDGEDTGSRNIIRLAVAGNHGWSDG